ncbi:tRNA wybutosine-synthesizing protein 4 [Takifugu flavidus]|uniref:tRNA wybutosine-synthesizing protein 4 n=1 Tax=Takifugu flavidus TaxID=433684 RepID=UPI0025446B82|nr:tRNA wybutosine-synthesizing protein 4 [Takifugu flavidus]
MATKTKKQHGRDTAVQGTNDSSVVSKVSAAAQGYFQDSFLQHFVCKTSRRTPLINRGYYVRWRAVDHCVKTFLHITGNVSRRQIVSLGAGFDSLYFRLHADGALDGAVVFEVDFPDVTKRKAALIKGSPTLAEVFGPHLRSGTGPLCVSAGQYQLLGVDVRQKSQVEEALCAAGMDWSAPTLILSEVVLTYMETNWSDDIISWAAKRFPQSLFVLYEQIRPNDPFGRIMQNHFLKINSRLHAITEYPDCSAQKRRFLDLGWDQCVCLDMNQFYLGLVLEEERCRVEALEPFDEHEEWHLKCSHYFILTASRGSLTTRALLQDDPVPSVVPSSRSHSVLSVQPVQLSVEGLGMATCLLSPEQVLLTGGSSRAGRRAAPRLLFKGCKGWSSVSVEVSGELDVRLHHTATSLPGGDIVVFGGRSSPLNPVSGLVRLAVEPFVSPDPAGPADGNTARLHVENMTCTGAPPAARWRHAAAVVDHSGENFLFVFGGKRESGAVLGDACFLHLKQQHWTEFSIKGSVPEPRHSHTACSHRMGGAVVFGGLNERGAPLGDVALLRPNGSGFAWEILEVQPSPVPRYSHSAHVIGDNLLLVGGVWLHSAGVPDVAVINLVTRCCVEFRLDRDSVPWPLMLHSFCSEITGPEEPELLLLGGGGNCFSFGTHFNCQPVTVDLTAALHQSELRDT